MNELRWIATVAGLLCVFAAAGCHGGAALQYDDQTALPAEWLTVAERSHYEQTGRYADAVALCRRLADAAPLTRFETFGESAEGRPLPLLIVSRDQRLRADSPRGDRVRLMIINCIHPGECAGKDASMALVRDLCLLGKHATLLDHVDVLILPIFNVDGHERFGPRNRVNQVGPAEMGWRTTATNLNLNRDFAKADTVEMQAWLRLWNLWQPDVLVDTHTTNGSDHRYHVLYAGTTSPYAAGPIASWTTDTLIAGVLPALAAHGWNLAPYGGPRDRANPAAGFGVAMGFGARYSTGYAALCNRPGLLIEAHAYKPYEERVRATHDFLIEILRVTSRNVGELRATIAAADAACAARRGAEYDERVPLQVRASDAGRPFTFRGWATELRHSPVTGVEVLAYSHTPVDVETTIYDTPTVAEAITPPLAYVIPPAWDDLIDRLRLHGVAMKSTTAPCGVEVTRYRLSNVEFADQPYEGRHAPRYEVDRFREIQTLPAGSVVVPLDQPRAKLAVHLLEPAGPDALVRWGLINAIFERKEYAETHAFEPLAQEMLAQDPDLRAAFEQRLRDDPEFAADPGARLRFLYRRSPWYDQRHDVYPVGRVDDAAGWESLAESGLEGR